ncbi:MAG: DEAD/DEAH box helicase family protein [Nostoc sp.]|uniref:DEAD/DEAH box helicase n=1 Tax=Nostoc sp. TaxID=1180 RepID=UPI002FEF9867
MLPHIKRREHQEKAIAIARGTLKAGKIPCLSMPTGSGKTFVGLDIADLVISFQEQWKLPGKILIICNLSPLMVQWDNSVLDFLGMERYARTQYLWGKKKRSEAIIQSAKIVISMAQTIESRDWIPDDVTHVIWDEAHLSWFRMKCRKIVEKLAPNAQHILLTATPHRLDGQQFGDNVEIHQIATLRELIANGTLCPFRAKNIPGFAIKSKTREGQDYSTAEVEQILEKCSPEKVFQEWDKPITDGHSVAYRGGLKYSDLPTIGVTGSKESAKYYCDYFTSMGRPGVVITDDTSEEERQDAYARFREGEILLWSVVVLTIGFDEKCATVVLMLRATKSVSLLTQILGRILRTLEGKPEAYFLDFTGTMVALGRPDEIEDWRDVKQNEGKDCPKCHYVCGAGQGSCPDCGYEFPKVISTEKEENSDDIDIVGDDEDEDDTQTSWAFDDREMEEIPFVDRNNPSPSEYYRQLLRRAYISGKNPESVRWEFRSTKKFFPDKTWSTHAVFGANATMLNAMRYLAYLRKIQSYTGKNEDWIWRMMGEEFGVLLTQEWVDYLKTSVKVVLAG